MLTYRELPPSQRQPLQHRHIPLKNNKIITFMGQFLCASCGKGKLCICENGSVSKGEAEEREVWDVESFCREG